MVGVTVGASMGGVSARGGRRSRREGSIQSMSIGVSFCDWVCGVEDCIAAGVGTEAGVAETAGLGFWGKGTAAEAEVEATGAGTATTAFEDEAAVAPAAEVAV